MPVGSGPKLVAHEFHVCDLFSHGLGHKSAQHRNRALSRLQSPSRLQAFSLGQVSLWMDLGPQLYHCGVLVIIRLLRQLLLI